MRSKFGFRLHVLLSSHMQTTLAHVSIIVKKRFAQKKSLLEHFILLRKGIKPTSSHEPTTLLTTKP